MNHPAAHIGTAADFFAQQHDEDDQPERIAPPGSTHPDVVGPFTAGPGMLYQIPPDPMERIATALEAIAGGNRKADEPGRVVNSSQYRALAEQLDDKVDELQTLTQVVADIDEALGKSKAGPALAAKAVIEAWRNPRVPAGVEDELPGHIEESMADPEYAAADVTMAGDPETGLVDTGLDHALETYPAGGPLKPVDTASPPANDAPVEAWREYARSQGFAGPEIDKANRSQIRTALGVVQPVEGGA